jgi:hypothetical protein
MYNLILGVLIFGFFLFAQERVIPSKSLRNVSEKAVFQKPVKDLGVQNSSQIPGVKQSNVFTDVVIGETQYDLQTNRAVDNRLYYFNDGTIGAVWTMGFDPTNWTQRGTGYNYFDGTNWGPYPTTRIEDTKTGWPSYTAYLENGEVFASHHMTAGIYFGTRNNKGSGSWETGILPGPLGAVDISWPRVMTSGVNKEFIHILAGTFVPYQDQETAITYSRSQDGGGEWEIDNIIIPGLGSDNYFSWSADVYTFAETRANTMAFVIGDQWTDLVLMKSTDDGLNWTKTVVWENPYPFFDYNTTVTDTFYCNDGSAAIALDNQGMAHITFGLTRVLHNVVGTSYDYFYLVDGVIYWNENMESFTNSLHALDPYGHPESQIVENYNLIGWSQDLNNNGELDFLPDILSYRSLGLSTMTNICIDDNNWIYVAYASTTEGYESTTYNYKHIWMRASHDNGTTWNNFLDLDSDLSHSFDECIYPNFAANTSDDKVFLFYQADPTPGLALDDDHPYQTNSNFFVEVNKSELIPVGIINNNSNNFNVSQNYPNPFNGSSNVYVMLDKPASLSLEVTNLIGQVVYSIPAKQFPSGKAELTIRAAGLETGVYFYTVRANETTITKKMMVE